MHVQYTKHLSILAAGLVLMSGCGGQDGENSPGAIRLTGPVSMALAASDQSEVPADGALEVGTILSVFPSVALEDFSNRFPAAVAEEQYRMVSYVGGTAGNEVFGIEGYGADGTSEIDAVYDTAGSFLSSREGSSIAVVPAAVSDVLSSLYPDAVIDESEQWVDGSDAVTYEVELESAQSEFEVIIDAGGLVLETSEEIAESLVPANVVSGARQELAAGQSVEYERVTTDGSVSYRAELEAEVESVEIQFTESGGIVSVTWELDI